MNCAGSERVESNKGFVCRNMGDVLGKECAKEDSLTRSVDDVLREEVEGAASSGAGSESESEKDLSTESDEDLSWLLPINTMELGAKKCKCEGCLKLFDSYSSDKKNAKLLLSSWKEFRNYIRNVYLKSPFEFSQKNESVSLKNNEKLHEIIQVMKLCDPYQLFQKIEDELCSMVLESRIRQLNLLKDESNPALAEEFITGLIAEYVKLLTSALQLSPAIENLLGPQLQKFGLTWEVLNKQLYRSLVYNHFDVQQNLVRFIEQLRKMLPFKDDIYHELVHQYLALDREMTLIGTMWKNVEPLIQEYRNLRSKENEKLNNLLDAMKDFFANKLCSTEDDFESGHDKNSHVATDDAMQYCPNCMTRRGCPCEDCTVTHMMSCEDILLGIESPLGTNTPSRSRSRSPIKPNESDEKDIDRDYEMDEQQSCECHACTLPPSDLIDCSATFDQSRGKNNVHGEGFQLYPHIHGTTSESKNMSSIYGSLQKSTDFMYPHLYNLHNQTNSVAVDNQTQLNGSVRTHQLLPESVGNKITSPSQPVTSSSPPPSQEPTSPGKNCSQSLASTRDDSAKNECNSTSEKLHQLSNAKKSLDRIRPTETVKESNVAEKDKVCNSKMEGKKNNVQNEKEGKLERSGSEKSEMKSQGNSKGNGCVISGICGKCCLKHGTSCLKMPGCNKDKNADKNATSTSRTGLAPNSNSRATTNCVGGKEDRSQRNGKSHLCTKPAAQDGSKKAMSKKGLEVEDSSSPDDFCSEGSNSTFVSTPKDPRHCDCCYCEVFGHGVPSVAPVSRNYQEMRERLRLRLSMKKSAKCKTVPPGQGQQQTDQKAGGGNSRGPSTNNQSDGSKIEDPRELDLESLLKYIEGEKKDDSKDTKKPGKKTKKNKRQKEKERLKEEEEEEDEEEEEKNDGDDDDDDDDNDREAENKKLKSQVTISLVNNNKGSQKQKRKQNEKSNVETPKQSPSPQKFQPQSLNLSGLKSLVEKSDPDAVPKMVTIRRVMAPFSAEPTVTITLKGSTPDKDKVLFMLKNGSENVPSELNETSKKSKKKKGKRECKVNEEVEEEEEEEEEEYAPAYDPATGNASEKKKKKEKSKKIEEETVSKKKSVREANVGAGKHSASECAGSKSSKSKNFKDSEDDVSASHDHIKSSKTGKKSAGPAADNSKMTSQKKESASKVEAQNFKAKEFGNKQANKNGGGAEKKSVQNNAKNETTNNNNNVNNVNNIGQVNKESGVKNTKSNNNFKGVNASEVQKGLSNNSQNQNNNNNNNSALNEKVKKEKCEIRLINALNQKEVKNQKKKESTATTEQITHGKTNKIKNKSEGDSIHREAKNTPLDALQKLQNRQKLPNLEICRTQETDGKTGPKMKNVERASMQDVEVNWKGSTDKQDKGKVIINTPSYRLSEVLSSIAPSPPPKEEINLENLRLPPGITITKIEGPISKPAKSSVQPNQISKPAPPIIMSTPILKPNPPPGNVIVVDTGRLKEVINENSQEADLESVSAGGKKKKKKNKQQAGNAMNPTVEVPVNQSRFDAKVPKNCSALSKGDVSVFPSGMDARKIVPNLENQQATIIKTSNNMVTIRSPALQQAINVHAYQNSHGYKSGMNGYSNVTLFNEEVTRINEKMGNLKLAPEQEDVKLARQMRNLNVKGESGGRGNGGEVKKETLSTQTVTSSSSSSSQSNHQGDSAKNKNKKKKKKKKGKSGEEKEVEPVESVFQPKDIDLENGDIDDDERELEAFKRFCFQSVPPERKNKMKVNLNIKDIVLKKKYSGIGCS